MTQQGFLFVGRIIFQSVVFLPCCWRFTERSVRTAWSLCSWHCDSREVSSVVAANLEACVCTQLTAPLPLSICEELWCCMLSPWEMRLVTHGNLYLWVTFELWGEDGNSFIPVLVPFLGKVSVSSGSCCFCCSSAILHRRHRITRFTGCFITADSLFLCHCLYSSPVRIKESRSSYLLLLGMRLILPPCTS